jgi:hypothetical protein
MKSKKLLLTIKDLKDLGLIGKRKKKSRRKRKADKKLGANSVISGVRSEFIGPTFGTQINRTTDLQNENIRLQNEKLLENVKNSENQNRALLQLIEDNTVNRQAITDADTTNRRAIQQIYTYGDSLQQQITQLNRIENDSVDTSSTGGSKYFHGIPRPTSSSTKQGNKTLNQSEDMYSAYAGEDSLSQQNPMINNSLGGGASVPSSQLKREKSIEKIAGSVSLTPSKSEIEDEEPEPEWINEKEISEPKKKYISQMNLGELNNVYKSLGGKSDTSKLTKSELRVLTEDLVKQIQTPTKKKGKKSKY